MEHLVWIDMEMTGLNPEKDCILEIAIVITDTNLKVVKTMNRITIGHKIEELKFSFSKDKYDELVSAFNESGLLNRVSKSITTVQEAEEIILNTLKKYCERKKCHLAGSSVWTDANFLIKHMPKIWDFVHYKLLDVTGIKLLRGYWFSDIEEFPKQDTHDAVEDINESIEQLRYYRRIMFR
jgi:oligoribonuclease